MFEAQVEANSVTLTWSYGHSSDVSICGVERSTDNANFVEIHRLIIRGNSPAGLSTYAFCDKDIQPGTYYYRLKQIDINGSVSYSRSVEAIILAPKTFKLYPNYPNPFNSGTQIRYEIPEAALVQLTVINTLGQEIYRIVDKKQEAGYYVVSWNGRDVWGAAKPSGLYFIHLQAGQFTKMNKMMLLR